MQNTLATFWRRFSKGFVRGSLLGLGLLAFGLLSWGIAILVGLEKDTSTSGISVVPLYVLSFGLGGGAITLLRSDRHTRVESVVAWALAVTIVFVGCCTIALLIESDRPIGPYWGLLSSVILLVLFITSAIGNRVGSTENNAEPDDPANRS